MRLAEGLIDKLWRTNDLTLDIRNCLDDRTIGVYRIMNLKDSEVTSMWNFAKQDVSFGATNSVYTSTQSTIKIDEINGISNLELPDFLNEIQKIVASKKTTLLGNDNNVGVHTMKLYGVELPVEKIVYKNHEFTLGGSYVTLLRPFGEHYPTKRMAPANWENVYYQRATSQEVFSNIFIPDLPFSDKQKTPEEIQNLLNHPKYSAIRNEMLQNDPETPYRIIEGLFYSNDQILVGKYLSPAFEYLSPQSQKFVKDTVLQNLDIIKDGIRKNMAYATLSDNSKQLIDQALQRLNLDDNAIMLYYFDLVQRAKGDMQIAQKLNWLDYSEETNSLVVNEPLLQLQDKYTGIIAYLLEGENMVLQNGENLFRISDVVLRQPKRWTVQNKLLTALTYKDQWTHFNNIMKRYSHLSFKKFMDQHDAWKKITQNSRINGIVKEGQGIGLAEIMTMLWMQGNHAMHGINGDLKIIPIGRPEWTPIRTFIAFNPKDHAQELKNLRYNDEAIHIMQMMYLKTKTISDIIDATLDPAALINKLGQLLDDAKASGNELADALAAILKWMDSKIGDTIDQQKSLDDFIP